MCAFQSIVCIQHNIQKVLWVTKPINVLDDVCLGEGVLHKPKGVTGSSQFKHVQLAAKQSGQDF